MQKMALIKDIVRQGICRQKFFYVAGIILLILMIGKHYVHANLPANSETLKLRSRGYSGNQIHFDLPGENIKEIEWVEISCEGFDRQLQVKSFALTEDKLKVELYESIPCNGELKKISFWLDLSENRKPLEEKGFDYDKIKEDLARIKSKFSERGKRMEKKEVVSKPEAPKPKAPKPKEKGILVDKDDIEERIREVFGNDSRIAIAVAKGESGLNPLAIGDRHLRDYSYGIFQINTGYHDYPVEVLLDPVENIRIAKSLHEKHGWTPWSAYKNGSYRRHLE